MEFTITFIKIFSWGVYFTSPVLIIMFLIIFILGLVVGRIESWTKFDSIYWAFITALTVGYGDIRPTKRASKMLSLIMAWLGIMLAGIFVAITVEATSGSFKVHVDPQEIHTIERNFN